MAERTNPPIQLRPATAEDAAKIRRLIWAVQINPSGLNWRHFVLAVDSSGEMVGCGQIKHHGDGSDELASIAVEPAWRGQGVARTIIEHLLEAHPGRLYLTCRSVLVPFYERFGFRSLEEAEFPPYFKRLAKLAGLFKSLREHGINVMSRG